MDKKPGDWTGAWYESPDHDETNPEAVEKEPTIIMYGYQSQDDGFSWPMIALLILLAVIALWVC